VCEVGGGLTCVDGGSGCARCVHVQMPAIVALIERDLSEPYSIFTYRYFINNWPNLCFLVNLICHDRDLGLGPLGIRLPHADLKVVCCRRRWTATSASAP
jgi:hypothetical protein